MRHLKDMSDRHEDGSSGYGKLVGIDVKWWMERCTTRSDNVEDDEGYNVGKKNGDEDKEVEVK